MKRSIYATVAFGSILVSCGVNNPDTSKVNQIINNRDDRQIAEIGNPAVGSINGASVFCTGFLISPNEIVTASHCLKNTEDVNRLSFKAFGQKEDVDLTVKYVNNHRDILVLTSKRNYSEYLDVAEFPSKKSSLQATIFEESNQIVVSECNILKMFDENFFTHDCDSIPGNSGAPILQQGKVVGVHLGYSDTSGVNIGSIFKGSENDMFLNQDIKFTPERCNPFRPRTCRVPKIKKKVCGQTLKVYAIAWGVCKTSIATAAGVCPIAADPSGVLPAVCVTANATAAVSCGLSLASVVGVVTACALELVTHGSLDI